MNKKAPWTKMKGAKVSKKKPRKPLRRVSKRQAQRLEKYGKIRLQYLKDHQACAVCMKEELNSAYWRKAVEVHHMKGRLGNLLFDTEYFLPVCNSCHRALHDNPWWAYERGYLMKRT